MSFEKEQLQFGSGSYVGEALNSPAFNELPLDEQAQAIGWAVGCPVAIELTSHIVDGGRGPEAMLNRYGEIGFWLGEVSRTAKEVNPNLYAQLSTSVARLVTEPVGKYEPESIPSNYIFEIPPAETLVGFALPRLIIKGLDSPDNQIIAADLIEILVRISKSPEELLAVMAEELSKKSIPPDEALRTVLPIGWFEEHYAHSMVDKVKEALENHAPKLWSNYQLLSGNDKAAMKIL